MFRAGRAGATGVSIMLVTRSREDAVPYIEKRAGVKFERVGAPQPAEMARIAAEVGDGVGSVSWQDGTANVPSAVPRFHALAQVIPTSLSPTRASLTAARGGCD